MPAVRSRVYGAHPK